MAKRMLIDAMHAEETRVVVVSGNRIEEFDFESSTRKQITGNIYLAKVIRVEPSLQAAFVEYGGNRHGFLAFNEIHPDYYQIPTADRQAILAHHAAQVQRDDDDAEEPRKRDHRRGRGRNRDRNHDRSAAAQDQGEPQAEAIATDLMSDDGFDPGAEPSFEPVSLLDPVEPPGDGGFEPPQAEDDETPPPAPALLAASAPAILTGPADEPEAPEAAQVAAEDDLPPVSFDAPAAADPDEESAPESRAYEEHEDHEADEDRGGEYGDSDGDQDATADASDDVASGDANEGGEGGEGGNRARRERFRGRRRRGRHGPREARDRNDSEEADDSVESMGGEDSFEDVSRPRFGPGGRPYKIQEVIKRRQIILVQVVKEERGNKGAALTTYLSLAGRYCVLMPNTARGGGISRKITNASDRKRLKSIISELEVPQGMGLIVRTAGANRTKPEVKRDFEYLLRLWESIRDLTLNSVAPALVYEEGSLIKRAIRDLYSKDIESVLVEGDEGYKDAKDFMRMLMPSHAKNVQSYKDAVPILMRHGVEQALDSLFTPVVQLKSGGYIVINQTEALVAIDVNSGRSTREHNIEDTALRTNLEAAEEVARQLRLRDLAGLIVIDFIDMEDSRNNRAVERKLKEALSVDRARLQIGRISPFGLLEMSRQRLRSSVGEISSRTCPHCQGTGMVRSMESSALRVMRAIEGEGFQNKASIIGARVPPSVAIFILNQKRDWIRVTEERYGITLLIDTDDSLIAPDYRIERLRLRSLEDDLPPPRPVHTPIQSRMPEPVDADEAVEDEEIGDEEQAEGGNADGRGETEEQRRKRRRRRRRRGRRDEGEFGAQDNEGHDGHEGHGGDEGEEGEGTGLNVDSAPEGDEAPAQAGEEAEDGDGRGPRRRRRRGRGRDRYGSDRAEQGDAPESEGLEAQAYNAQPVLAADMEPAVTVPVVETDPVAAAPAPETVAPETVAPEAVAPEAVAPPAPKEPLPGVTIVTEPPAGPPKKGWWSRTFTRD